MASAVWNTLRRLKWEFLGLGFLYALSVGAGLATSRWEPEVLRAYVAQSDVQSAEQAEQVERVFGRFREPLREGRLGTMVVCGGLLFTINLLGDFVQFTLLSIPMVPMVFTLFLGGWMQGINLAGIHGSSFLSVFLFVAMGLLEWATYVMAGVAGLNIGLSVIHPKRQATSSRWQAFKGAWGDAGRLYIVIVLVLAVEAAFEILYVRKVLLMGGSGVPLMPY